MPIGDLTTLVHHDDGWVREVVCEMLILPYLFGFGDSLNSISLRLKESGIVRK
jgi:hypothetical protein